jgi:hypothetical protein
MSPSKSSDSSTAETQSLHDLAAEFGRSLATFHQAKVALQPEYKDSWRKRGPQIAFANLNRKMERLDSLMREYSYDILEGLVKSSSVRDCFTDILVYIGLHVSDSGRTMSNYFSVACETNKRIGEKYGEPWQLTQGIGAYADISRKMDSLQQFAKDCGFNLLDNLSQNNPLAHERVNDLTGYMLMAAGRALQINPNLDL